MECTETATINALVKEMEHFEGVYEQATRDGRYRDADYAKSEVTSRVHSIRARVRTQEQDWHRADCEYHAGLAAAAARGE